MKSTCEDVITDRNRREGKVIGREAIGSVRLRLSVRLSVHLFPLYLLSLLNRLIFELEFCVCVGHNHSSPRIESQGLHGSRSKVNVQRVRAW